MDIEQKQSELIDHFVKRASAASDAAALSSVLVEATSHPSLFAFSEILALPNLLQLEATENSAYLDMLRLFAHGTWNDYKSNADRLPQLIPDQILKLKQLTVLTLAETYKVLLIDVELLHIIFCLVRIAISLDRPGLLLKIAARWGMVLLCELVFGFLWVLPYDQLMQELDVTNVRELEDFLINECMYAGIVRGKLDQLRRCFEVQFAAGRDLRPDQLGNMIQTLSNWLSTSENMLVSIQEKIKWADAMSEIDKKHRKDVEEKVEEVKKSIFKVEVTHCKQADIDFRGHEEICSESGGVMDYEEDRSRPKRRRHPIS
ncbi:COP9 signalosome complex subunit 7 [Glycine soja]